jgi:hypothetical protein
MNIKESLKKRGFCVERFLIDDRENKLSVALKRRKGPKDRAILLVQKPKRSEFDGRQKKGDYQILEIKG